MNSRLQMTARNAFWNYFSMIVSMLISFVSRTVFIYCLGEGYLGISGLFSNVLGVLSFAELGIGTAIGFSLYKPVAEQNIEKIKAYMHAYKIAYRYIAIIIGIVGLSLTPFLHYFVKDPGDVGDITLYYLIFLFNTVISYFVSYKFSLVNAEQKNYIFTNANLIINTSTTILQIFVLLLFKNYLVYLLTTTAFGVIQKAVLNHYFERNYPYLNGENSARLTAEEKKTLVTKVKALMIHKIGDISVHQTDNIIVSAFVSTTMVGLLSNYNMLMGIIGGMIKTLFNSVTGSLGNLIATENKERQYEVFCKYRFLGFWLYGFSTIALGILMSPFITLWIGERMVVDQKVIALIMIDYYMIGHRICLNNFKSAAGAFEPDKYIALIQAVVNLAVSIGLVKIIGLPGVYIGTLVQGCISTICKPILTYQTLFQKSSCYYFIDSIKYTFAVITAYAACVFIKNNILYEITILRFIIMMGITAAVPNLWFYLLFRKTNEFNYFLNIVKNIFGRKYLKWIRK